MNDDTYFPPAVPTPKFHHSFLIPQLGRDVDVFLTMKMMKVGKKYDWLPQTSIDIGADADQKDNEAAAIIRQRFGISITSSEVVGKQPLEGRKGILIMHLVHSFDGCIDLEEVIRWHKGDYKMKWSAFTFETFENIALYQQPLFLKALELLVCDPAFFTRNPEVASFLEYMEGKGGTLP